MVAQLVSDKRPIIEVTINNKPAYMLVDTGSSLGILDITQKDDYGFSLGSKLQGVITGMGGDSESPAYHVKNLDVSLLGIGLYQFITTDISSIRRSIEQSTGIKISGIIGTTQIKMTEMKIDLDNGVIKIGY